MALTGSNNEQKIWNYLMAHFNNKYGVAGLMGNIKAESALSPINLQDSFEPKLGFSDQSYTDAVDSGRYTNFIHDSAGYGLAQWTFWSRKRALYEFAKKKKKSIGDLEMQLEFLVEELKGYTEVYNAIKNGTEARFPTGRPSTSPSIKRARSQRPSSSASPATRRSTMPSNCFWRT